MSPAGGDHLDETTPAAGVGFPCIDPFPDDPAPLSILIVEAYMYELLDQIRQLEIELAQALNRAKDSVALLEEAVQRLKDHRLELEAGEDRE
jgi:hypothetical protein